MDNRTNHPDYSDSAVELLQIIQYSDEAVQKRIPPAFIEKLVAAGKRSDHAFALDRTKSLAEQVLLPETRKLLCMIYEHYLEDDEERRKLRNAHAEEFRKSKLAQYQSLASADDD